MMASSRKRNTALNAVANVLQLTISGIAGLVVMRVLLLFMGSNYNGLNSTVAQLMTVLVLVSSSFTTASLISMYKPYNHDNWVQLNLIISTSRRVFRRIGAAVLLVGIFACVIYAHFISSDIPVETMTIVLLLSLVSTVFNIVVVNTYRLVFQVSQTEYIVTIISTCYTVLVSIAASIAIVLTEDIIIVRLCYVVLEMASGLVIQRVAYKKFKKMRIVKEHNYALIKGTKDVFAGAVTGVFYRTSPTLFLASMVGTAITSVYYVYDSIVSLVRSVVQVFVNAPKNALGQVIHEENLSKTTRIFQQYEYVTFFVAAILFSVTFAVILPFVSLYTRDVSDVNYLIQYVPILLVLIAFVETIHIPSGLMIQLSGHFRTAKHIQYSALFVLIVLILVFGSLFGLLGILLAIFCTALLLTVEEVYCARKRVLRRGYREFLKVFIVHFSLFILLGVVEAVIASNYITSYLSFILISIVYLIINSCVVAIIGKILFRDYYLYIRQWLAEIFRKVVR